MSKMSKQLRDTLNEITVEDFMVSWRDTQDPIKRQPISVWANIIQGKKYEAIEKNLPHIALDCIIAIWEKYLEHFDRCRKEAQDNMPGAYWDLEGVAEECPINFDKLFYYHYDLPYCVAYMEIGMSSPTKEYIHRVLCSLKAIRKGQPSIFSEMEKEQIKKDYWRLCYEHQQEKDFKRYFDEDKERSTKAKIQ